MRTVHQYEKSHVAEDGDTMERIHKLEVAQATEVAVGAAAQATPPATQAGATAAGAAWPGWRQPAPPAGGFSVSIFLGLSISKAK